MENNTTEVQKARMRLLENRIWVDNTITDLQQEYKNKWVVVQNKAVIDSGPTPRELKAKVQKEMEDETLIIFVPNIIAKPI